MPCGKLALTIRSSTQIWVVMLHQCEISAFINFIMCHFARKSVSTSRNVSCFPKAKYRDIHMYLTVLVEQHHCGVPEYNVSQMTYDIIMVAYISLSLCFTCPKSNENEILITLSTCRSFKLISTHPTHEQNYNLHPDCSPSLFLCFDLK